jgi:hypothetical protein
VNTLRFPTTGPTTNSSTATTTVKPEAATAVIELLTMGVRTPKHVELYINVK